MARRVHRPGLRVHACFLDPDCGTMTDGRLWRIHVTAWGRNIGIALTPGSRFAGTSWNSSWHTYNRTRKGRRIPTLSPTESAIVGADEDWLWDRAEWLPPARRDG